MGSDERCTFLQSCNQAVETTLEKIFGKIGHIVGHRPWVVIFASVVITFIFGSGFFLNWTTESRTEELWVPQDVQAKDDQDWVIDVFGYDLRFGEILLKPDGNGNALEGRFVRQFYTAYAIMRNTTSKATSGYRDEFNATYSWDGIDNTEAICFKPDTRTCSMDHILDVLGYDYNKVFAMTDEEIIIAINNESNWESIGGMNTSSTIFGGARYDDNGNIVSVKVLRGSYIMTAAVIIENNERIDPSREQWELKADGNINDHKWVDCNVIPFFDETFSQEFSAAIGGDAALFGIGYTLIIVYAAMALGKRDHVHSMIGIAVAAILTVGLSIVGSYGFAGALGIIFTPLSGSLPFLVLGLGVDDAFIIVGEFQQVSKEHPDYSPALRMEKTMKHAGVSILITSITDITAFFIGASTVLPALQAYCLFAAFGVIFVFFLNITFFAGAVVIDAQRATANRADCLCCWKLKQQHPMFPEYESASKTNIRQGSSYNLETPYNRNPSKSPQDGTLPTTKENEEPETPLPATNVQGDDGRGRLCCCFCCHLIPEELTRKAFRSWGYILMKPFVKIIVLCAAVGLLSVSIYGATQLKQDFNIEWFLPDDSYLQDYYDWKNKYFEQGNSVSIYTKDIDYFERRNDLYAAAEIFETAKYLVNDDYTDWHAEFISYTNSPAFGNMTLTADNYYDELYMWLDNAGRDFNAYIEWNDEDNPSLGIRGAYITGEYQVWATKDAEAQVKAMNWIRDDVSDIAGNKVMFPFTFSMLFWEQYAVIAEEMWRNIGLAVCVVFFIAIILIPNIIASMLVLTTVAFTIIDTVGLMYFWDLTIDGVTVCYTVIAIGLAVDYSAHVGEAYMLSKAKTRDDRVIDSLYRMGASVFNGAFSTFLAVLAMAFAETYIFRVFFKMFFLVTTIGGAHGLIVLPVLLSLFGPEARLSGHEDSDDGSNSKEKKALETTTMNQSEPQTSPSEEK